MGLSEEVIEKRITKWNYQLVGRIDDEWKIPELLYKDYGVDVFLDELVSKYVDCFIDEWKQIEGFKDIEMPDLDKDVLRGDGWINYMKEAEYNPIHMHTHCSISTIFYLNDYHGDEDIVDKTHPDIEIEKYSDDGHTTFVGGSTPFGPAESGVTRLKKLGLHLASFSPRSHFTVKPKTGLFFIFPAWLLHSVSPFRGKEKRVSASVNYGVRIRGAKKRKKV